MDVGPDDDVRFRVPTLVGDGEAWGIVIGVAGEDLAVLLPGGTALRVRMQDVREVRPWRAEVERSQGTLPHGAIDLGAGPNGVADLGHDRSYGNPRGSNGL